MTTRSAWRRRLDFRFDEVSHYLTRSLQQPDDTRALAALVDHARALWSIALRIPLRDVVTLRTAG